MPNPGVVYTREWVVDFVLDVAGYTPDRSLAHGRIVEPSCGNGAFLRRITSRLCESAEREGALAVDVLENCVRAYDSDYASVARSREVVALELSKWGMLAEDAKRIANTWVICDDFLLSDVAPAQWIVGNPPYVRSSLLPREVRELYSRQLPCMTMGTDLYVGFYQKGLSVLEDEGSLCFICADRWLQNRYGSRLRSFVASGFSLDAHIRMHEVDAFEEAVSAYPAISLIRKGEGRPIRYIECQPSFSSDDVPMVEKCLTVGGDAYASTNFAANILPALTGNAPVLLASSERYRQIHAMAEQHPTLEDAGIQLGIGVASGCDSVYITENPELVERDRMLPLFFMRDWRSGKQHGEKYLVNPWKSDGTLVNLDEYPQLKTYFENNADKLRRRRVAKDHPNCWYRTLDKIDDNLVGKEMLLFPDMSAKACPVYSDGSRYPHHNCYWMTSDEWDIKALGGLMMSDLVESFVDAYGVKMRGSTLRFQAQYLRLVHIPRACDVDPETMQELAEAFADGDRERANSASRKAFGLEAADA